jgi:hypothetical protein
MTPVLAAQVALIRDAADLIEQAGTEDVSFSPSCDGEIVIQVPGHTGSPAERAAKVAALAALAGCEPVPDHRPGPTRGWLFARGLFAGHPVRIYTSVTKENP